MTKSSNRLTALAGTLLLGSSDGTSIQGFVERSIPGFSFLRQFFATWLRIDLTALATALTILGTISGPLQDLQGIALKLYWWFTKLFTSSISITSNDRLNREILNWISNQILMQQGTRILTARTENVQTDAWYQRSNDTERNDLTFEKRVPIQYLPTFGTTWFIYEYHIFLVRRISTTTRWTQMNGVPDEYAAAPEGDEPLVIMCLGRSVEPIKRFLATCRDFSDTQREAFITVRASKNDYSRESWDTTTLRPIRPMETVHFDETTKAELVADIVNYLNPATRRFYTARGIPYRRGYLLHGPPGTGKTSLSLALAGRFGLELYLLHIPSVREDNHLENLFAALPPRCIVLLEDIDAVGIKGRQHTREDTGDEDNNEDDSDTDTDSNNAYHSRCTLSGLLNVLDGVASQEGRIVFMTSNMAHKLDKALVRPGRIDKMIFLGNISQKSAELMFLRMYAPDQREASPLSFELNHEDLQKAALEFSTQIPENIFTPAQIQGYLLNLRSSPDQAVTGIKAWISEEVRMIEVGRAKDKKAMAQRIKKRKEQVLLKLSKLDRESDNEIFNEVEKETIDNEAKKI
ncbi:hypothetical protein BP6252_10228 [Coleophoma cylindrospora]|uniref:Uncharacterized protein n=1 Tax=Coleophoma cylindrospora TaxID=1849047 RepID=A0A3D8QS19_9HELO|nr:hypothetical protein BP6252_10228 [Coleophoma cylindrospora]